MEPLSPEFEDPRRSAQPSGRTKWVIGGAGIVALALALAALLVLRIGTTEPNRLADPLAAPAGAFFTRIDPVILRGAEAEQLFRREMGGGPFDAVPDTVVYIGRAQSETGAHDLYSWVADGSRQMPLPAGSTCFGQFTVGGGSGGSQCGHPPDGAPSYGGGGGLDSHQFNAYNLPDGARWIVIETDLGARIVGNVVGDFAFVSWPSDAGSPRTARLLDERHAVLWTQQIDW